MISLEVEAVSADGAAGGYDKQWSVVLRDIPIVSSVQGGVLSRLIRASG